MAAAKEKTLHPESALSPHARDIADIIGVTDLVTELKMRDDDAARSTDGARVRMLELRQQISDRLLLASFAVHSVVAEAACEESRADHLADRLQEVQEKRVRTQTIIAIVGDAMIGIVAGGLSLAAQETASAIAAIIGGGVATGFGLAAFFGEETHQFEHRRNLLREIWEGPDQSRLFPASVWKYLTTTSVDAPSLRQSLIEDWRADGYLGQPGSELERKRLTLFFGNGGLYTVNELRTEAEMLDSLRAAVNLMNQDLHLLFREVVLQHEISASISTP
jgi:hypothetical protein